MLGSSNSPLWRGEDVNWEPEAPMRVEATQVVRERAVPWQLKARVPCVQSRQRGRGPIWLHLLVFRVQLISSKSVNTLCRQVTHSPANWPGTHVGTLYDKCFSFPGEHMNCLAPFKT